MKTFCLNKISKVALENLEKSDVLVNSIEESEVVLVRSQQMHELKLPTNVLAVARAGAGVNNIPLETYAKEGVVVFNTPGANANGVKELVLAGLMISSRDIVGGIKFVQDNKENTDIAKLVEKEKSKFAGVEVVNKKIGVIGLGVIGVLVANMCKDLGMDVVGYDPYLSIKNAMHLSCDIKYVEKLEELYSQCDYITLHLPLNKDTEKIVNKEAFSKMKKGTVLLNFARDSLVDDEALKEAIDEDIIKKYVTDFPNYTSSNMKNTIAIPHLGASTQEAEDNCAMMAIRQLKDYVETGGIKNSVNYPDCEAGIISSDCRIAINHYNKPGMINKFTDVIMESEGNIAHLVNKSKGAFAYTILDIDGIEGKKVLDSFISIDGVLKVRVIK